MSSFTNSKHSSSNFSDKLEEKLERKTQEIRRLIGLTAQNVVDIGTKLREVKEILGYGKFGPWLKKEFQWSIAIATKMMQVSRRFENVDLTELSFSPSALYLLAAPSTSETAIQEALSKAREGKTITYSLSQSIVRRHQSQEEKPFEKDSKTVIFPWKIEDSLKNKKYFESISWIEKSQFVFCAMREWKRMSRNKIPLSFIYCQIFSWLNLSSYNRQKVLLRFSELFGQNLKRPGDLVTHTEDGQLWILLPETDREGTLQLARKIHQNIEKIEIFVEAQLSVNLMVYSLIPNLDDSLEETLQYLFSESQKFQKAQGIVKAVSPPLRHYEHD